MPAVSTIVVARLRTLGPIIISALFLTTVFIAEWQILPPRLIDQCLDRNVSRSSAPIVVVGVISADTLVRRPVPMHSDPQTELQLRRLTIHVENVLKGGPLPGAVAVYYFTWAGGFNGPRPLGLWRAGGRRVWWLRRDSGVLRTVCDGWDGCTMDVESGAHHDYRPDPQKSVDYALADLLLTRGEGTTSETGFASEISWGVPDQGLQGYVIEKLRRLALMEHGDVKESACKQLWIYSVDRIGDSLRVDAAGALREADCHVR